MVSVSFFFQGAVLVQKTMNTDESKINQKTPQPIGKKARKKIESQNISQLARDICRCAGYKQSDISPVGMFGAIAGKVQEIVGKTYSGKVKTFIKAHQEELREWCRANWVPRPAAHKNPYKPPKSRNKVAVTVSGSNVASDAFLSTFEWRRVRMMALKKYGPVCQCCGATPATGAVMNVDHIKPRKLFPLLALDVNNLQILCHECNHGKGNWDVTDWRRDAFTDSAKLSDSSC